MNKFLTIAAVGALASAGFSAPALAKIESAQSEMGAEEHQRMMSSGGAPWQMMSDPDMHRRMVALMDKCEEMMAKKDNSASISGQDSTKKTSAEGKWAWRADPRQGPGPRAQLLPPIRVWVPAERSPTK